jgi:hypothetical protein
LVTPSPLTSLLLREVGEQHLVAVAVPEAIAQVLEHLAEERLLKPF